MDTILKSIFPKHIHDKYQAVIRKETKEFQKFQHGTACWLSTKPVYITIRILKKFTNKWGTKIKVGKTIVSLAQRANWRGNEVNISYQIAIGEFAFGKNHADEHLI
jgi:hypothetical protein